MPRPTRKKLKFDEESVNNLLQEIYNDSHNIRAKIARLFTKWESKVKNEDDIVALSESIIKLINAEAKNQDQKIMLLKYLKEVVYKDKQTSSDVETEKLDADGRKELMKMVKKEITKSK